MSTRTLYTAPLRGDPPLRTLKRRPWQCIFCRQRPNALSFSTSSRRKAASNQRTKDPFGTRLRRALKKTKVEWSPIPVGLGIGFLGLVQFYRTQQHSKARQQDLKDAEHERTGQDVSGKGDRPKKRERIRPSGPWYNSKEKMV